MYKIIVRDPILNVTATIEASTYEEAAHKYFYAATALHPVAKAFLSWEIEVMGVKFKRTESATGVVSITRPAPPSPVVEEIKLILPAWLRN